MTMDSTITNFRRDKIDYIYLVKIRRKNSQRCGIDIIEDADLKFECVMQKCENGMDEKMVIAFFNIKNIKFYINLYVYKNSLKNRI